MIRASCPICGAVMEGPSLKDFPFFPFCSARCKTIDLGRWLGETYRIPADDQEDRLASPEPDLP